MSESVPTTASVDVPREARRPTGGVGAILPLALLGLLTAGCTPPRALDEYGQLRYEGDMVDVWAQEETPICSASFSEIDRVSGLLREYAQASGVASATDKFRCAWIDREDWDLVEDTCGEEAGGCYRARPADGGPAKVYAKGFIVHEVVHAVFGPASGSFPLFEEGLANMLRDSAGLGEVTPEATSFLEVATRSSERVEGRLYDEANRIVRFMLDAYGPRALQMMESTHRGMDVPALESVLDQFSMPLAEIEDLNTSSPICVQKGAAINLPECSAAEVALDPLTGFSLSFNLACDQELVYGPLGDIVYTTRSFVVPAPDAYELSLEGRTSLRVYMGLCGRSLCAPTDLSSTDPEILLITNASGYPVDLDAGKHWFTIMAPLTMEDLYVHLSMRPA